MSSVPTKPITKNYKTNIKIYQIVFKTAQIPTLTLAQSQIPVFNVQVVLIYLIYKRVNVRCVVLVGYITQNNANV